MQVLRLEDVTEKVIEAEGRPLRKTNTRNAPSATETDLAQWLREIGLDCRRLALTPR